MATTTTDRVRRLLLGRKRAKALRTPVDRIAGRGLTALDAVCSEEPQCEDCQGDLAELSWESRLVCTKCGVVSRHVVFFMGEPERVFENDDADAVARKRYHHMLTERELDGTDTLHNTLIDERGPQSRALRQASRGVDQERLVMERQRERERLVKALEPELLRFDAAASAPVATAAAPVATAVDAAPEDAALRKQRRRRAKQRTRTVKRLAQRVGDAKATASSVLSVPRFENLERGSLRLFHDMHSRRMLSSGLHARACAAMADLCKAYADFAGQLRNYFAIQLAALYQAALIERQGYLRLQPFVHAHIDTLLTSDLTLDTGRSSTSARVLVALDDVPRHLAMARDYALRTRDTLCPWNLDALRQVAARVQCELRLVLEQPELGLIAMPQLPLFNFSNDLQEKLHTHRAVFQTRWERANAMYRTGPEGLETVWSTLRRKQDKLLRMPIELRPFVEVASLAEPVLLSLPALEACVGALVRYCMIHTELFWVTELSQAARRKLVSLFSQDHVAKRQDVSLERVSAASAALDCVIQLDRDAARAAAAR